MSSNVWSGLNADGKLLYSPWGQELNVGAQDLQSPSRKDSHRAHAHLRKELARNFALPSVRGGAKLRAPLSEGRYQHETNTCHHFQQTPTALPGARKPPTV